MIGFGVFVVVTMVMLGPELVTGHGRMIEPAARNCMWRFNYKNPRNYNDMGLNCGGFTNQFERQGGRCGVCGDPSQGSRDHEAGGKYARGLVARQYKQGAFINVTVELTSNHQGYFEFRLCPVNDPHVRATKACLDSNLLNIVGHGTRYFIRKNAASVYVELIVMLPPKLRCSQCVLQWKWVAGQSMGPDGLGGECLGCGNQENFVNCADIAIGAKPVTPLPQLPDTNTPATPSVGSNVNLGPAYSVQPAVPQTQVVPAAPSPVGGSGSLGMTSGSHLDASMASLVSQLYNNMAAVGGTPYPTPVTPATLTQAPAQNQWSNQLPALTSQTSSWQQNALPSMFGESFSNWIGSTGSAQPINYPGYEQGEYPEVGESPPASSGHIGQSSSQYMQGFNDALRQMQGGFGSAMFNTKSSPAFNELSLSFSEAQKGSYTGGGMKTCPDGSELECRSTNQMFGSDFDSVCQNACSLGECPTDMCACSCPSGGSWSGSGGSSVPNAAPGAHCQAVDRAQAGSMDRWCSLNCAKNNCPSNLCVCY